MLERSEISRAIAGMAKTFYKTLKVNLNANSYQIVKTNDQELNKNDVNRDTFSSWIESFANAGYVHENDRNVFKNRLSIGSLKQHLKNEDSFRIQYRRKVGNEFRWVSLEILKTDSYTEEHQVVWLYVRDIHNNYVHEMEIQRELEHYCKFDTLTGLNNYYSYQILCKNFAASEEKNSVGLIFADLNGLKLINDTRGHGAGNEFLQSFARKLLEHFSSEYIYRISGDEFFIVIPNCEEKEFTFSAKKFEAFLNQEVVPQASIGYAWMAHPVHIEDVSSEAEKKMYNSKEAFYEKHPEYKRGIAEINYKREMDAILKTLANSYDAIITIDLIRDSFWILKQGPGVTFGKDADTFSKMNENFITAVDPEYVEMLAGVNSIDNLRNDLRKRSSITIEFKMRDGRWVRTTFKAIETMNGDPTKVLLITEHLDHERILELEKNKDLMLEHQIIEGLSKGFTLICQIDVPSKNILVYKNIALKDSIPTAIRNLSYDGVITWFVNKFVIAEDRERTDKALRMENVLEKIKDRDVTTVLFRTTPEFHDTTHVSYSMFYFYRLASNPNKLVLATKNVTNSMG